jgi:hypothetical protein
MCGIDCGEAHKYLAAAVLSHANIEEFCNIPLRGLRESTVKVLDLSGKKIGTHGAVVLCSLLKKTK